MTSSLEIITSKRKSRSVSSFLKKTFDLLHDQQNYDLVRWAPNGIGFIVVSEEEFAKHILPKYFKHSNYSSFVRQLNMYNFHKIRETNSESYFHHQNFDRDNKQLLAQIRRKPEKKKRKLIDDQESEFCQKDYQRMTATQNKENLQTPASRQTQKVNYSSSIINQSSSKLISEDQFSSKNILRHKCLENNQISTTKQLFSSEFTLKFQNPISDVNSNKKIEENLWEEDDDKISINDEIEERIQPFPTKELMCPSKHKIYPCVNKETENFNVFY